MECSRLNMATSLETCGDKFPVATSYMQNIKSVKLASMI
jgi:hypothetical protein